MAYPAHAQRNAILVRTLHTANTAWGDWRNPDQRDRYSVTAQFTGNRQGTKIQVLFFTAREVMSSPRKSEEEDNSSSDEALEEVNSHIREAFEILKRETKKVRMEKEALDEAAKKLEHVHFSAMLKLNVGGHLFSTSLATLNKDPGICEICTFIVDITRPCLIECKRRK